MRVKIYHPDRPLYVSIAEVETLEQAERVMLAAANVSVLLTGRRGKDVSFTVVDGDETSRLYVMNGSMLVQQTFTA